MTDSMFKPPKVARPLKDQDNYHSWATSIARILRLSNLASVVTGTETTQPTTSTTAANDWQTKVDKALITIIANCEEEAQILIEGCDTAADAWSVLKEHYEGRPRAHLTAPFNFRFDDREGTISEHIAAFENKWNLLRLHTASATAGTDSMAAGIKNFANSDSCKATMLLATLPGTQTYQNIIEDITTGTADPSYATTVSRLKELLKRTKTYKEKSAEPPSTFATTKVGRFCGYCQSKGWPGTSHNESECRTKRRDQNRALAQTKLPTTDPTIAPATGDWLALNVATNTTALDQDHSSWLIGSCSSFHITHDINDFITIEPWRQPVRTGAGVIYSTHRGTVTTNKLVLEDRLYVPGFPKKIISVGCLAEIGWSLSIGNGKRNLSKEGIKLPLQRDGGLYKLQAAEVNVTEMEGLD